MDRSPVTIPFRLAENRVDGPRDRVDRFGHLARIIRPDSPRHDRLGARRIDPAGFRLIE